MVNAIRAIIVEDDRQSLDSLVNTLSNNFENINVLATCSTVEDAIVSLTKLKPELVFLDIEINDKTAFDLLDHFQTIDFKIIFITSHEEFALKAFRYAAIDYLLKPFDHNDLNDAISKVMQFKDQQEQIEWIRIKSNRTHPTRIALNTGKSLVFVNLKEILYMKSDDKYALCFLESGEKIHINNTLKDFQDFLPSNFYRIHKSYLINTDSIKKLEPKEASELQMMNGDILPIAYKRKTAFFEFIKNIYPLT